MVDLEKLFRDEFSKNLKEPTCENFIHEVDVMINDLGYCNIWTLITYWMRENNKCLDVQSLEQIVDIIGKII